MTYELVLKLKNAGFPFEFCPNIDNPKHDKLGCELQSPTLEELIEACGNEFGYLAKRFSGGWRASKKNSFKQDGKTSEEAVANLWLSLNSKT